MGAPLFLKALFNVESWMKLWIFQVYYMSWRKLPGLKHVWIQQVDDFSCLDVNFRVWNASEFNKSKILFEECSRFSLLHIQKICVKRYMKCLYFSLKLIGLPGCSIRFWKSKKGKFKKCCEGATFLHNITRFSKGTSKWKYWCYLFLLVIWVNRWSKKF